MPGDGSLKVGMKFGTFGSACKKVANLANKLGGKIKKEHDYSESTNRGEYNAVIFGKNLAGAGFGSIEYATGGSQTVYDATVGGITYIGVVDKFYPRGKDDEIMKLKFTEMRSADGLQRAVDKNGNGIVDAGEIEDTMW